MSLEFNEYVNSGSRDGNALCLRLGRSTNRNLVHSSFPRNSMSCGTITRNALCRKFEELIWFYSKEIQKANFPRSDTSESKNSGRNSEQLGKRKILQSSRVELWNGERADKGQFKYQINPVIAYSLH